MVNIAQMQKRELEIGKMITVFVDYNWHQKFSKDIKVLVAKKKKNKIVTKKEKSTIPLSTKKNK